LLREDFALTVVDNLDDFYDPQIKRLNLAAYAGDPRVRFVQADIRDKAALRACASHYDAIVHLAAKAGVRPSFADPAGYHASNVGGVKNLLELARECGVPQVVFASSSSVYGSNPNVPWSEQDEALQPISPYAVTKREGELLGQAYSSLHGFRFVALRLFTVYGPRQRPDLAIHKFARLMLEGRKVPFYGDGSTRRDYTYVDDIVSGIRAAMDYTASQYEIFNLGNNHAISLSDLVAELAEVLGVPALLDRHPEQRGDVPQTWADISKARELLAYRPQTALRDGLRHFAAWLAETTPSPSKHVYPPLAVGAK
jgi:UDP-glucuronate 4-epimerase